MKLSWEPITLDLKTTFRIAHGASDQRFNVVARLEHAGLEGLGEGPGVTYLGESQAGMIAYLESVAHLMVGDPALLEDSLERLPPGSHAARAALDMALHDLWGKLVGQPLYRLFGLNPARIPPTSFTIAIDRPEVMAEQAQRSGYPIIKIKVGSDQDEAIVRAIRRAIEARLRVDANAGWSLQQAADLIPRLAQYDLEMIEQPLPVGDIEGLRWLRQHLHDQHIHLPIFADESIKTSRNIIDHAGAIDGVVIKLAKTGGLREALRLIAVARAFEMQVMVSCMVETSLGVTAAAHLAPLCDYVDLDGPLLIRNDPFQGLRYQGAQIILPDSPGLGVNWAAAPMSSP